MIRIRREQMAALDAHAQHCFRARVAAYLRAQLPDPIAPLTETDLAERIARWQVRAAAHGVRSERGVAKWCYLSLVLTEAFDEEPAIREYLGQPGPPPDHKVDMLMRTLEVRMSMTKAKQR
jgi:hypothetical protein